MAQDKILDSYKPEAVADKKINSVSNNDIVAEGIENINIVGKGEKRKTGYKHVLLFENCLQKLSLSGSLKYILVLLGVSVGMKLL